VSSIEGRSMGAMSIRNNDNSDCPIKYPDPNSKEYCECVVGRADNFVCSTYHLSTSPHHHHESGVLMVGAVVLVVGMGVGGVAFCVSHSDKYTLFISS
jgi:hypothetical protein